MDTRGRDHSLNTGAGRAGPDGYLPDPQWAAFGCSGGAPRAPVTTCDPPYDATLTSTFDRDSMTLITAEWSISPQPLACAAVNNS